MRLKLKAPFSPLYAQFTDRAGMMVSPKAAQAAGDQFGSAPVCAGPYKFVRRVVQDKIWLEKFDQYWNAGEFPLQDRHLPGHPGCDGAARQSARRVSST